MRYLEKIGNWKKSENNPIFVYCGNEGSIDTFWANSGNKY
jgi:hypothetical protein